MSLLSAKGIVRSGQVKTAFSVGELADTMSLLPEYGRNAYYGLKDLTYPVRSALRISDYNDRIADRLAQLSNMASMADVRLNRAFDEHIVSPVLDFSRF